MRVLSRQFDGWCEQPNVQVVVADINNQDALEELLVGAISLFILLGVDVVTVFRSLMVF